MSRFTERRSGRKRTYEFEAIDRVRYEALSIATRSDANRPRMGNVVPFALFLAMFSFVVGWTHDSPAFFVLFGVLVTAVMVAQARSAVRRQPAEQNIRARFVVALDSGVMTIRWGDFERSEDLSGVERFELSKEGIDLVRRDGSHQALPFTLGIDDPGFAAELGTALERTRASGGYRGAEPEDQEEPERARERR